MRGGRQRHLSLLIPSSKIVSVEMQNEFGPIPPILVPMMGRIAFHRIMETFRGHSAEAYIGIQEGSDAVEDYFEFFPNKSTHLVRLDHTDSISDTLEQMISINPGISEGPSILNFADTVVADLDSRIIGKDFVSFSKTVETERWTLFKDQRGKISEISDKVFRMNPEGWKTFIGVWGISDTKRFLGILAKHNEIDKREAFYRSISEYYNSCRETVFSESRDWMDCGHVDNYYLARKRLMNTRFFNKVKFDDRVSSLLKTSMDTEKLVNEINWYVSIPPELRYYVPNIFNHSTDPKDPFIEMEYYSYPSLDDCFVYARFDFDVWDKIFSKIFSILSIAAQSSSNDGDLRKQLKRMYVDKTLRRLKGYLSEVDESSVSEMAFHSEDGRSSISASDFIRNLPSLMEEFKVYDVPSFQVIHGDLCFSNILYDNKHGITKLVDPRGSFGVPSIFGDVYYDLAKLSHSALGFYDFIMFDQFRIKEDQAGGAPSLVWRASDYHETIGKIFIRHLQANGYDLNRTRFLECLLFLSMLPLHRDSPTRQRAMMIRGLNILCDLMERSL